MNETTSNKTGIDEFNNAFVVHRSLRIQGVHHQNHVQILQRCLTKQKGVKNVDVDVKRARVKITYDAAQVGFGTIEKALADAGYAGEQIVETLEARGIEPLIAISRQQGERAYDFRPPKTPDKPPPKITAPWRLAMCKKLQTDEAKNKYRKRKQTVEPVFGIIKSVLGFTRFHLRGIDKVKTEWMLVSLAHNCKRLAKLAA